MSWRRTLAAGWCELQCSRASRTGGALLCVGSEQCRLEAGLVHGQLCPPRIKACAEREVMWHGTAVEWSCLRGQSLLGREILCK